MELIIRDIELSDVKQLKNFKCENTSMEVFLAEEAYYYHVCGEGITKLVVDEYSNELVAYFTLKCDKMIVDDPDMYTEPRHIPCIEISRLAVASKWQQGNNGIHIGTELMKYIISSIHDIAKIVGCRYITLHSVIDKVKWYRDVFNFEVLEEDIIDGETKTVYMCLDITDNDKIEEYLNMKKRGRSPNF
jgi:hypothetical protein